MSIPTILTPEPCPRSGQTKLRLLINEVCD